MEDASSIWEKEGGSGVSVLSAQLSACSVMLGWLLSSNFKISLGSLVLVAALAFASWAQNISCH